MIPEKSLVIYKNRPALVTNKEGEKFSIRTVKGDNLKVREKDIELIHPGPCTNGDLENSSPEGNAKEAWELMSGSSGGLTLKEFAELLYGEYSPGTVLAAWEQLAEGLYFTGSTKAIEARPAELVSAGKAKLEEKQRETGEREAFLERVKKLSPGGKAIDEADRRFLRDVEALAHGLSDKSRTLKDLGRSETPQEAHRFLLACGLWTGWENPYPTRMGISPSPAKIIPPPAPEEERIDLSHLPAFAIDNAWSDDPDDALSLEGPDEGGRYCLWVHTADPAASVLPGSPADSEARNRGATLYLPEGNFSMLAPELLPLYALDSIGKDALSPALSFKLILNNDLSIAETSIFLSRIKVTRLTYEEADALVPGSASANPQSTSSGDTCMILTRLLDLAERNLERRLNSGAVLIDMPEVHINVCKDENKKHISVEPVVPKHSAGMVRECMLLAGEGAARWALKNRLPFPFISQEEGELPDRKHWPGGFAECWQLRRCMRPRNVSVKPGVHWGLGLDEYTQVTSPLRRYTDLLCHQQIRAFLKQKPVLSEEEITLRLGAAEAAATAAAKAERASRLHWLAVYLSGKKDSSWEGIVLDNKSGRATVLIPELGLETQVNLKGKSDLNETVELILLSSKISEVELIFTLR